MTWKEVYKQKCVSADEAASVIQSGDNVMVSGANSAPPDIINALCRRYMELENVTLWSGLLMYGFDFLTHCNCLLGVFDVPEASCS